MDNIIIKDTRMGSSFGQYGNKIVNVDETENWICLLDQDGKLNFKTIVIPTEAVVEIICNAIENNPDMNIVPILKKIIDAKFGGE
jgi:hypothetical protein